MASAGFVVVAVAVAASLLLFVDEVAATAGDFAAAAAGFSTDFSAHLSLLDLSAVVVGFDGVEPGANTGISNMPDTLLWS